MVTTHDLLLKCGHSLLVLSRGGRYKMKTSSHPTNQSITSCTDILKLHDLQHIKTPPLHGLGGPLLCMIFVLVSFQRSCYPSISKSKHLSKAPKNLRNVPLNLKTQISKKKPTLWCSIEHLANSSKPWRT